MYKQIMLWILALIFINKSYGQKTPVFENKRHIGYINEETDYDCNNCYFLDSIIILKKRIIIKEPVYVQGRIESDSVKGYFANQYSFVISNFKKNISIIKFNSTSNGNSYWLYVTIKNNYLFIIKQLSYSNAVYKEEPVTKVCTKKINKKILKSIDFYDFFEKSLDQNCHFCSITTSIEECVKKFQ